MPPLPICYKLDFLNRIIIEFEAFISYLNPLSGRCEQTFWAVPCRHSEEGHLIEEANTLDSCKKMCQKVPACKGINWLPEKAKCWLTHQPTKQKSVQVTVHVMAEVSKCKDPLIEICTRQFPNWFI